MNTKAHTLFAVTATTEAELDAPVSAHFGHCPHMVFVRVGADSVVSAKSQPNPFAAAHRPGQLPAWLAEQGVNVVLAGGMGGGAIDWFSRLGITPVTGFQGTVREAVQEYLAGRRDGAEGCKDGGLHECGEAGHG